MRNNYRIRSPYSIRINAMLLFVFIFSLQSCNLLYLALPNEEIPPSLAPDDLDLKMAVEVTNLRIDLYRNTSTEETSETDASGNKVTEEVDRTYSPLGFYICKGIFFDIHGNLSLVVPEFFPIEANEDFKITQSSPNTLFDFPTIVTKEADQITIEQKNPFINTSSKIKLAENKIIIKGSFLSLDETITISDDKLILDPNNILGALAVDKIIRTTDGYKIPNLFGSSYYSQPETNKIVLDHDFVVIRHEDCIEFKQTKYSTYYLYKQFDGYVFTHKYAYHKRISISQDKIERSMNNEILEVYTIEK